jgi:aryl-alcohol dehydrogenase-like predicted oxidoreductase
MSTLNRREFSGLCVAVGSFTAASALDLASSTASTTAGRTVKFRDGTIVSALGQGSANLGKGRRPQVDEEEAVRTGLSLGMTLIDTAEIYGSEEFIGRAIAGQRDRIFLVSKVSPNHVAGTGVVRACEASLKRLGTDHLDLYLLHWPTAVTNFPTLLPRLKNYARQERFVRGASPISRSAIRKISSVFHKAIAVRLINSPTVSGTGALSVTCSRGAGGTACR